MHKTIMLSQCVDFLCISSSDNCIGLYTMGHNIMQEVDNA